MEEWVQTMPELTTILTLIFVATLWKLIWYGIAIYKTVQRKQPVWFTVLFVAAFLLGDLGILAIIYLLIYSSKNKKTVKTTTKVTKKTVSRKKKK